MANVESGNWVLNAAEREQVRKADPEENKRVLEGRLHPGKVLKTFLRGLHCPHHYCGDDTWQCDTLLGVVRRVWFNTNLDNGMDGFSSVEMPKGF